MISDLTFDQIPGLCLRREPTYWVVSFQAMACPCEVLIRTEDASAVKELAALAVTETRRIEQKFSRYRDDNIVYAINNSEGTPVTLDAETCELLAYAGHCYELSNGLFDITSGILRKVWSFKGEDIIPDEESINQLLNFVGWDKVRLTDDKIRLAPGMEIDFGGIGKEYAVDRVARILIESSGLSVMVNFGGDIRIPKAQTDREPWSVGIADPESPDQPIGQIEIHDGAVTTSGVSYRHCFIRGKRYSHILNPRTGWPVEDPPRSVTVIGNFCLEAGILSTLAMLQGKSAEKFLRAQKIKYHCIW
jgi:thiamine biosynthesis lipoprotein